MKCLKFTIVTTGMLVAFSAPAGAAGDDACVDSFNAMNRINTAAGPYELVGDASIGIPGQSNTIKLSSVMQVIPPKTFHMKSVRPNEVLEFIDIDDQKAWVKKGDGKWAQVAQDKLPEVIAVPHLETYFPAQGLANVKCNSNKTLDGEFYLSVDYDVTLQGIEMRMTSYFDPSSHLPIEGRGVAEIAGGTATLAMTFKFDRAIKIEAPAVQ
jgi:hypothetical protein